MWENTSHCNNYGSNVICTLYKIQDSRFQNFIHTVYMQWMYIGKKYE